MDSATESTGTLLASCNDQKGIVAALAQLLYGHGANILDSSQHSDTGEGRFFQRIRFDMAELRTDKVALTQGIEEVAKRFSMTWRLTESGTRKRVAIFVSKYDHCLYDLLLRHRSGELVCDIPFVVSNHPDLKHVAEQFGVPYHHIPNNKNIREEAERKEIELIEKESVDLIVLARYMQILSADFTEKYAGRVINIHHSFLPAFVGGRPYHQAAERGVKLIGATAHYATTDLDEGPIIEQDVIRSSHRDRPKDLVRKGRDIERNVLSNAVRWHLGDRILICSNKTVILH